MYDNANMTCYNLPGFVSRLTVINYYEYRDKMFKFDLTKSAVVDRSSFKKNVFMSFSEYAENTNDWITLYKDQNSVASAVINGRGDDCT